MGLGAAPGADMQLQEGQSAPTTVVSLGETPLQTDVFSHDAESPPCGRPKKASLRVDVQADADAEDYSQVGMHDVLIRDCVVLATKGRTASQRCDGIEGLALLLEDPGLHNRVAELGGFEPLVDACEACASEGFDYAVAGLTSLCNNSH
eukprot:3986324-Prymnesium_polylepis.1